MSITLPTPGRIVMFANERYPQLRPAIVESVNDDGTLNLVVFTSRSAYGTQYEDNVPAEGRRYWQWPVIEPAVSVEAGQAIVDAAVEAVGKGEDHPVLPDED